MTHTSTEQPEALRLAECLDFCKTQEGSAIYEAAAELRRLHARVQELETQVQRVPLSDEQIEDLPVWKHFVGMLPAHWIEIARAIEAAHGITQEKQG